MISPFWGLLGIGVIIAVVTGVLLLAHWILFRQTLRLGKALVLALGAMLISGAGSLLLASAPAWLASIVVVAVEGLYFQKFLPTPMKYGSAVLFVLLQSGITVLLLLALSFSLATFAPETLKRLEAEMERQIAPATSVEEAPPIAAASGSTLER